MKQELRQGLRDHAPVFIESNGQKSPENREKELDVTRIKFFLHPKDPLELLVKTIIDKKDNNFPVLSDIEDVLESLGPEVLEQLKDESRFLEEDVKEFINKYAEGNENRKEIKRLLEMLNEDNKQVDFIKSEYLNLLNKEKITPEHSQEEKSLLSDKKFEYEQAKNNLNKMEIRIKKELSSYFDQKTKEFNSILQRINRINTLLQKKKSKSKKIAVTSANQSSESNLSKVTSNNSAKTPDSNLNNDYDYDSGEDSDSSDWIKQ